MKKIVTGIIIATAVVGLVFLFRYHPSSDATASTDSTPATDSTTVTPLAQSNPAAGHTATQYKDGTFTGTSVDATYGIVQVAAVVSGSKLTDIKFLQMPNDHGNTQEVTAFAQPRLKSESLQAQSANVDIVSGATQTSEAFIQSLQTALDQAHA